MLKLRFALCLALIVGTLTLTNGILNSARMLTIIYRIVISVILFGLLGYGLGIIAERFFKRNLVKIEDKGEKIDIASEPQIINDSPKDPEFSPFTSDNFEQITRPKE